MSILFPRYPRPCRHCGERADVNHLCDDPGESPRHAAAEFAQVGAGIWKHASGAYVVEPSVLLEIGLSRGAVERVLDYCHDADGCPTGAELDEQRGLFDATLRRLRGAVELARESKPIVLTDVIREGRAA